MKRNETNELLSMIQKLSAKEQEKLVGQIMNMMSANSKTTHSYDCNSLVMDNVGSRPDCPHCRASAEEGFIMKKGFKRGVQRFYCKKCSSFFVPTTNTAFAYTHKDAVVWKKFIQLTISGASLKKCSKECNIAYQTAFTWRHKILSVFAADVDKTSVNGIIEMDEMLIPISYKGNHVQGHLGEERTLASGKANDMPRNSFKRGSDNKSTSSKDKMCVFCMVENGNRNFYVKTPGVGFMQNNMLDATVGAHVNKYSSVIIVDEYKVTKNYLENNGYSYKSLLSNTSDNYHDHKPEIVGAYHLQHVNAMHHHIRNFLRPYCGVSSKYLNNYLAMYVWIRQLKVDKKDDFQKEAIARFSLSDCFVTRNYLEQFPAIPMCA